MNLTEKLIERGFWADNVDKCRRFLSGIKMKVVPIGSRDSLN